MGPEINVVTQSDAGIVCKLVPAGPQDGFLAASGFTGQLGETRLIPGMLYAGLGSTMDTNAVRRAVAALARTTAGFDHVSVELPSSDFVRAAAEAYLLGGYRFTAYKSMVATVATKRLDLVCDGGTLGAARLFAEAVIRTRDLVNEPGGTLTPIEFAHRAASLPGLKCDVWDQSRIAAERLGGLIGVNRGSAQPARLLRLEYSPDSPDRTVALVGKGITFDSGGLTIKTHTGMQTMKADMAGAAAVVGVMSVLSALACRVRVVGWIPLTDNMSGGDATRIGDVLRTRSGKTVEVLNADAEGRLVLADALTLAAEEQPDEIIDIATLTDSISVTLGRRYVGVGGNDHALLARVSRAARQADELVWLMPSDGVDRSRLKSKVADLLNAPNYRYGQSVLGTLFLSEFVPAGIPWAHMDISGPSFTDEDDGEWTAGGTGVGVRTLLEYLLS